MKGFFREPLTALKGKTYLNFKYLSCGKLNHFIHPSLF